METGRPRLVVTCLALIHTAGPQKGPPSLPCWSRAGLGDPVGRQGPGPGQGLVGQGWGRDQRVGRGGPGCPRSAGLGGQQVGTDLTKVAVGGLRRPGGGAGSGGRSGWLWTVHAAEPGRACGAYAGSPRRQGAWCPALQDGCDRRAEGLGDRLLMAAAPGLSDLSLAESRKRLCNSQTAGRARAEALLHHLPGDRPADQRWGQYSRPEWQPGWTPGGGTRKQTVQG